MNALPISTRRALLVLALFAMVVAAAVVVPMCNPHAGAIVQIVLYAALASFVAYQLYICLKLAKRLGKSGPMRFTALWFAFGVFRVAIRFIDLRDWPASDIVAGDIYFLLSLHAALLVIDGLMRGATPGPVAQARG